jgi:antitoxin HicB
VPRYPVLLIPRLEDDGYTAHVPALPGCFTEGDTADAALANARAVIRLYLEDKAAHGEPIPEERGHPSTSTTFRRCVPG